MILVGNNNMNNPEGISAISHWPGSGTITTTSLSNSFLILVIYGAAHLIVDACCAALVSGLVSLSSLSPNSFFALLLLYHVLAFALQPLLRLAMDAIGTPRLAAVLGCLISRNRPAIFPDAIAGDYISRYWQCDFSYWQWNNMCAKHSASGHCFRRIGPDH